MEADAQSRHPFLSFMLWWLLIGNVISAVTSPFLLTSIRRGSVPDFPDWVGWPFAVISVLAAICVAALFQWKRWGFYGYAVTALMIFTLNVYAGVSVGAAILGFVGTIFLFIALHVGGGNKAWPKLK
ncbi:hypothetical protein [Limnoglobus roseus]|uniref:Uncharacterized protein n=1 Tax=Limnoglobus roseus TaxID=2598579 RepID=A0A5C1AA05_9BACT|nr:hypothetical protein [Limnoglobus roseus]QEL15057.1 hypothetical protein PX52LOC_01963 [Limnoglobus roseus]